MKKLPLWRRPWGAKKILEVGGGHDPYAGVTHAVDKFPQDNGQRGGDYVLPSGAKFFLGDLENLPFPKGETFDFFIGSHVFEHVANPSRAAEEINRVAKAGYIETPSPLREQLACPIPFNAADDFHTLFCWSSPGFLNVIRKSDHTIGEFPKNRAGHIAFSLFRLQREKGMDLEPLLPRSVKTTKLFFDAGFKLREFSSFREAAKAGCCAFEGSVAELERSLSFPFYLRSRRLQKLKKILDPLL